MWHEVKESQIKCNNGNQQLRTTAEEASAQYTIDPLSGETLQPLGDRNCGNSTRLTSTMVHSNTLEMTMTTSRFSTLPSFPPSAFPARKELYALRPLRSPGDMRPIYKQRRLHPIHTLLKEVAIVLSNAHTTTDFPRRIHVGGKEKRVSTLQALLGTPRFSPPFFAQTSSLIRKSAAHGESQANTVRIEKNVKIQSAQNTKDSEDVESDDSKKRKARSAKCVDTKPHTEFRCSMCERKFVQKGRLFNHVRVVHERQRAYKCPHRCGQTFGAKGDLTRHVRSIHEGRRPFRCSSCDAAFSRKSVLVRHCSKVHTKL